MKKLYEIKLAYRDQKTKEEIYNVDSYTVIADDAFSAPSVTNILLEKEREAKKEKKELFVEEIRLISIIDVVGDLE